MFTAFTKNPATQAAGEFLEFKIQELEPVRPKQKEKVFF
jgi:hypothetical protein